MVARWAYKVVIETSCQGSHNLLKQRSQDGHYNFLKQDMIAIPGISSTELFVVKVTGGILFSPQETGLIINRDGPSLS